MGGSPAEKAQKEGKDTELISEVLIHELVTIPYHHFQSGASLMELPASAFSLLPNTGD